MRERETEREREGGSVYVSECDGFESLLLCLCLYLRVCACVSVDQPTSGNFTGRNTSVSHGKEEKNNILNEKIC